VIHGHEKAVLIAQISLPQKSLKKNKWKQFVAFSVKRKENVKPSQRDFYISQTPDHGELCGKEISEGFPSVSLQWIL